LPPNLSLLYAALDQTSRTPSDQQPLEHETMKRHGTARPGHQQQRYEQTMIRTGP
jgi:hypothetical protein